jgi:hypothetical protein
LTHVFWHTYWDDKILPTLKEWVRGNHPTLMPHNLCMFKFILALAGWLPMDKAYKWGIFQKCMPRTRWLDLAFLKMFPPMGFNARTPPLSTWSITYKNFLDQNEWFFQLVFRNWKQNQRFSWKPWMTQHVLKPPSNFISWAII